MKIQIQNIVATISLQETIPLAKLANFPKAEYNPKQFPGLVLKLENPSATALVFASGALVLTGAYSEIFLKLYIK